MDRINRSSNLPWMYNEKTGEYEADYADEMTDYPCDECGSPVDVSMVTELADEYATPTSVIQAIDALGGLLDILDALGDLPGEASSMPAALYSMIKPIWHALSDQIH